MRRELLISGVLALVCHGVFLFGLRLASPPSSLIPIDEVLSVRLVAGPPLESPQGSVPDEKMAEPLPIAPEPEPQPEPQPEPPPVPQPLPPPEPQPEPQPVPPPQPEPVPQPVPQPVPKPVPKPAPPANRTESLPIRPRESSARPPVSSVPKPGGGGSTSGNPQLSTGGGAGNTKPRYRFNPQPSYPAESRQAHQEGRVLLVVDVNTDGNPTRVEIKQGSGFAALDLAALNAVRRWKFEPARKGGVSVEARVEVPVQFSLGR